MIFHCRIGMPLLCFYESSVRNTSRHGNICRLCLTLLNWECFFRVTPLTMTLCQWNNIISQSEQCFKYFQLYENFLQPGFLNHHYKGLPLKARKWLVTDSSLLCRLLGFRRNFRRVNKSHRILLCIILGKILRLAQPPVNHIIDDFHRRVRCVQ